MNALTSVLEFEGPERTHFLLDELVIEAHRKGTPVPYSANTPYLNTIPPDREARHPGDRAIEHRIRSLIRWNAMAMVVRANKESPSSAATSPASHRRPRSTMSASAISGARRPTITAATWCTFRAIRSPGHLRARLSGRADHRRAARCNFRQEVDGNGLSSYPHPWLMPEFWQFPTVSMGLGPLMAIYQARFLKYLHNRGLADTEDRKVWAFMGDGEMDEPESLGAISLAAREGLDNLIFVINCNLQRLDGPVRGNGKIIQELEAVFRGAGWNVIKVIWGRRWDPLLAQDTSGIARSSAWRRASTASIRTSNRKNGAYVREHFFGKYPELQGAGRRHVGRRDLEPQPRRPRSRPRSTPPTPPR